MYIFISVTSERVRFIDDLDIIKYICKEYWLDLYKKQADKLQTNHKVYLFIDLHHNNRVYL